MKVLIAIMSWDGAAVNGDEQAQRDTWLQDVAQYPNVDYKFFIGDDSPSTAEDEAMLLRRSAEHGHPNTKILNALAKHEFTPQPDEVILHAPDDYEHGTCKMRELFRWAIERDYDFIFLCCTDTYVNVSRLMNSGFEKYDYCGLSIGYGKGGQGVWHSNKAARVIVTGRINDWAWDRWVGAVLEHSGIHLHDDRRYVDYPQYPQPHNDFITSHLAESCAYDNALMRKIHPSTDVVISATQGYDWDRLHAYANSLVRSGFSGTKLFFVDGITQRARQNLLRLGFTLVDFHADNSKPFVTSRFAPVVKYLAENASRFRYIIWVDCRDLVFQTDPSAWLEKHLAPHKILGASECCRIKDEPLNDQWVRTAVPHEADWVREHDVLCGGTVAGEVETMKLFFDRMQTLLNEHGGVDQPLLNYLFRMAPFTEMSRAPKMAEGWTATAGWCLACAERWVRTDEAPVLDKKSGTALTPNGKTPFVILHQYDRNGDWQWIVSQKYKDDPQSSIQPHPTVSKAAPQRARYAADGLTLDWFDTHPRG